MAGERSVILAGGGTGGHIYPNVAIAERLAELAPSVRVHYLVSDRPGDAATMRKLGASYSAGSTRPLPPMRKPWRVLPFLWAWRKGVKHAHSLLREHSVVAVVATGGFVSGPAIIAAARSGIACALVNLDAIPGKANRRLAREASVVFSAYDTQVLPGARTIGLPLRQASRSELEPAAARAALGLDPQRPLLFVTGATHGAESVVRAVIALVGTEGLRARLRGWQVLHQCGTVDRGPIEAAYAEAGITARVVDYLDTMGLAWRGADVAISRAGAGSVAEAWANATPTVFLPNPYHADQHQRHNAEPMAAAGGARIVADAIDPQRNVAALTPVLEELLGDAARREAMRRAAQQSCPPDGATAVARWVAAIAATGT